MENERGKSKITLVILIVIIIIGANYVINYAKQMRIQTDEQDLKTNMLFIQAETKKGLEEVCFRTVNLKEEKEEDKTKINEIKEEYLKGTILSDSPEEVKEATKKVTDVTFDENCYYLDEKDLIELGIKEVDSSKSEYFIVKYDFSNTFVEVINTKGINGKYTLTQISQDIETE